MREQNLEVLMEVIDDVAVELFVEDSEVIELSVEDGGGGTLPYYNGEYVVTPKVKESQTLSTKNKSMKNDVLVLEIPYTEVHNEKGITFTIGGEQ